jgi:hypothetical protein
VNDSELNEMLRDAQVPERSTEEWRRFSEDTMWMLGQSAGPLAGPSAHPPRLRLAWWVTGFAGACIIIGISIAHWYARRAGNEIADARKLFGELNAVFPDRLEAVMLDSSSPRLILADKPFSNSGAPIFLRICGSRGCQRVITFSGQRVRVNGENCEVLLDARGGIIVTGDTFAWSSAENGTRAGHYRIHAAPLSDVL